MKQLGRLLGVVAVTPLLPIMYSGCGAVETEEQVIETSEAVVGMGAPLVPNSSSPGCPGATQFVDPAPPDWHGGHCGDDVVNNAALQAACDQYCASTAAGCIAGNVLLGCYDKPGANDHRHTADCSCYDPNTLAGQLHLCGSTDNGHGSSPVCVDNGCSKTAGQCKNIYLVFGSLVIPTCSCQ